MQRLLIGLALGLVAGSAGLVANSSRRADQAWREMLAIGDELQDSIDRADARRPVLYGEGVEGNAYDDYGRALALLSSTADDEWRACRDAGARGDEDSRALRDALLDEHEEMLRTLAQGAHRTSARCRMDWEQGFLAEIPRLLEQRALVNLAVLAAERHLDEGRPDRAAQVLLDGMQLGRDHFHGPLLITSMVGCALLNIAGKGALIDGGLLERIPPPELRGLADGMRTLDAGLSMTSHASAGEIVLFVRHVESASSLEGTFDFDPASILSSWRYGFSVRRMCAAFVQDSAERLEYLRATEGARWPDRKSALQSLYQRIEGSDNPITQMLSLNLQSADESLYGALTQFRLARAAVEYRLDGRVPRMADPFGGEFVVTELDEALRIESAGPDQDWRTDLYSIEIGRELD